jgi:hypothetical protein
MSAVPALQMEIEQMIVNCGHLEFLGGLEEKERKFVFALLH